MACVPFSAEDVDGAAYAELRDACLRHRFLPAFRAGLLLDAAMPDPRDEDAAAAIRRLTHQELRRFGISRGDFERAVERLEAGRGPDPAQAECREGSAPDPPRCPDSWEFHQLGARQVAARLIRFAHATGASDLLVDDQERWTDLALKVDGRKEILPPLERASGASVLRALKEMAGMSTHAANLWQSGALSLEVEAGRWADLRVEATPSIHGESLVARIQDRKVQLERMRRLPFDDPEQRRLAEACLSRPQGLIVAAGPTGHGKTSTLYACLGGLDRSLLNIRTLEDPVEFVVPWITQIPVGAGTGRSFADGLKSLLRQAPHVILMGEIRDAQVAQTCLDAVDTGHLILATLHARGALGVISRLLDLGMAGRQIAGALTLAIGQRLARRLCRHCRRSVAPAPEQAARFRAHGLPVPPLLWTPAGCSRCGGRGERGMVPLFELFHPGRDELREAMARQPFCERELRGAWLGLGGSPLAREGLRRAAAGEIAFPEIPFTEEDGLL